MLSDDLEFTSHIDESKYDEYKGAVDKKIRTDPGSAITILEIIRDHPECPLDFIKDEFKRIKMESGWDESIFDVPSSRKSRPQKKDFREAVDTILTEMFYDGYITKPETGLPIILKKGIDAIESKDIKLKGSFNVKKRIQSILRDNPSMSDEDFLKGYESKFGVKPDEFLKQALLDKRYERRGSGSTDDSDGIQIESDTIPPEPNGEAPCSKLNIILYGPPGTGKTLSTKKYALS